MGDPVLLLLRIDVGLGSFDAKAGIFFNSTRRRAKCVIFNP
jgi:hypothetical protein